MGSRPSLHGFVQQQLHFDFLPATIVANLTQKEARRSEKRAFMRSRPTKLRVLDSNASIDQIPLDLLIEPILVGQVVEGLSPALREVMEDHGDVLMSADVIDESDAHLSTSLDWSDQAIAELHEGLLLSSLASLAARGNATEKVDVLKWFFSPDIYAWNKKTTCTGEVGYQPIYSHQIPFTFQRCCAVAHFNHEVLREGLLFILRKAGLGDYLPE
ncbi:hypothetical protein LJR189_004692 [Acidovorax delafieldii]|uniref:hypothetical protein n=1 Tax=Acidovorax delafieldii TaxID=47920 RepID=UPI003ECF9C83